jgi:Histidine kinase-, DNA gyrase B-, and HSP90-like ATPase/PAS fold
MPDESAPKSPETQSRLLAGNRVLTHLLDSFPEPAFILNEQRQIVLANTKVAALLGHSPSSLIGLRPGEAFGCLHSRELPGGCGTTQACKYCGAAKAIINPRNSEGVEPQECRIRRLDDGGPAALDFVVRATPVRFEDGEFTVFAIHDISDEKRRAVLERLFFHDVINTAGGLKGLLEIWPELQASEAVDVGRHAHLVASQLLEEIQAQRDLIAAERGDLSVALKPIDVLEVLQGLRRRYMFLAESAGKHFPSPKVHGKTIIKSEPILLVRVLDNLIKNAFEASRSGDTITLEYENHAKPIFRVHNPTAMPEEVCAQIFQRSFTTKGPGYGLGTYSAKLFTERYLRGVLDFTSRPAEGTTFRVVLPA